MAINNVKNSPAATPAFARMEKECSVEAEVNARNQGVLYGATVGAVGSFFTYGVGAAMGAITGGGIIGGLIGTELQSSRCDAATAEVLREQLNQSKFER